MGRIRSQKQKLTDKLCRETPSPSKGNRLLRCALTQGLALRVTKSGFRSFVFCYSAPDGRERRMTIGKFGDWSLAAARKRVHELRRQVNIGDDPLNQREEARKALTIRGLWQWYAETELPTLSSASQRDILRTWQRHIETNLGPHRKVEDISRRDVQKLLDKTSLASGPYAGNRAHSYLRRILNLAVAEELIERNVASLSIRRNQEHPRLRYLTEAESSRLWQVLQNRKRTHSVIAIQLLMLTGARRSEVLGMRWEELNLENGIWTKSPSRTKQRRIHRVPLSAAAIQLLREHRHTCPSAEFVFPSKSKCGHSTDLKRCWRTVTAEANIADCRLHDLRHSFASVVASNGGSLETIGALLGHSQAQTTLRYAHLFDEKLRQAMELVASKASSQSSEISHRKQLSS